MASDPVMLGAADWRARVRRHRDRLAPWVTPHLERRARQEKHPVYDFLFEYYRFPPARLLNWSPGFGLALEEDEEETPPSFATPLPGRPAIEAATLPRQRREGLTWVTELLRRTAERPPRFACFGLHEWAMVYEQDAIRHRDPLRLPHDEIRAVVEQLPVCCSHCDAFRFFPETARPLNRLQPTRANQADLEQPGCLHANMDLYKWAYKFYPWTPSDLIGDAFLLAMRLRELDMRASPYDLAAYGVEPIRIETEAGRLAYVRMQSALAGEAQPLREALVRHYEALLGAVERGITRVMVQGAK